MIKERKIILIVEDEVPMQKILADTLKESGYAIFQANDGEEGLQLAFAHHPDLILLDLLMPKMDGMTMMTKLRKDEWGKSVPVIMLTNVSADTDKTIQAIVESQPAYYLIKSDTKIETILEKINEIILQKKQAA